MTALRFLPTVGFGSERLGSARSQGGSDAGNSGTRLGWRVATMRKKLGIVAMTTVAAAVLVLGGHAAFAAGGQHSISATSTGSAAFTSQTTTAFTGSGTATLMGPITTVGDAVNSPRCRCRTC